MHTAFLKITYSISSFSVFRDLKPANIGFDVRGDGKNLKEQPLMICIEIRYVSPCIVSVKIFDFGLARVMPEEGDPNNDAYDMSGAGSPR